MWQSLWHTYQRTRAHGRAPHSSFHPTHGTPFPPQDRTLIARDAAELGPEDRRAVVGSTAGARDTPQGGLNTHRGRILADPGSCVKRYPPAKSFSTFTRAAKQETRMLLPSAHHESGPGDSSAESGRG